MRAAVDSPPPADTNSNTSTQTDTADNNEASKGGNLFLQAGAFSDQTSAQRLQQELINQLGVDTRIQHSGDLFRVWIGPYESNQQRQQVRETVANAGFDRPMPVSP